MWNAALRISAGLDEELADPTTNFISLSLRYVLYLLDNLLQILMLHKRLICKIIKSTKWEEDEDEDFWDVQPE